MKLTVLIAALAVLVSGAVRAEDGIVVEHAWARETPPGISNGVVYMTIHNHSGSADRLMGVSSKRAARSELHTSFDDNGVMKMRPLDTIELSAGGQAMLEPGADHIMLLDLNQPLKEGETVDLELDFVNAATLHVDVPVRKHANAPGGHTHSSD